MAAAVEPDERRVAVRLPVGQVQALGVRRSELLGTAACVYADRNKDGLLDTWTATLALPGEVTDASQLATYVALVDRWDAGRSLTNWRIRPVTATIADGIATLTGALWLLGRPSRYDDVANASTLSLDPKAGDLLDRVSIYREWIDPHGATPQDAQATLIWETRAAPPWACACNGGSTDPAAVAEAAARAGIRNATVGLVTPGEARYDTATGTWHQVAWGACTPPDQVLVRALAGLPLVDGAMQRAWQETVTYLALAETEGPLCACEGVRKRLHHWQFDLARSSGANDEAYGAISGDDLSNPFGTRRGQVEAWKRVRPLRTMIGLAF